MTRREWLARMAGLVVSLLPLAPAQDRRRTSSQAKARLELVAPGS